MMKQIFYSFTEEKKKKKRLALLLALVMSLTGPAAVWADEEGSLEDIIKDIFSGGFGDNKVDSQPEVYSPELFITRNFEYYVNVDDETITITDYVGEREVVEVPSELDGYRVTEIGSEAFSYRKMKRISFPDSLMIIHDRAFEYSELTEVTIPEGVIVEPCAFGYNDLLKQVVIEPGAVIKSRAFGYCENLDLVVCGPGSVLEDSTFAYCDRLESVILCGEVELDGEAFSYCDRKRITEASEDDFDFWKLPDEDVDGQGQDSSPDAGPAGGLAGGWYATEDASLTEDALKAYEEVAFEQDGVHCEAVALLATQVVAGVNYCFLQRTTSDEPGSMPSYSLLYVYENLDGEAEILDTQSITIGLFQTEDGNDGGTEPLAPGEHRITMTGEKNIVSCPPTAKAGDRIVVFNGEVADGRMVIEVNGQEIEGRDGEYAFIMPDEDVEVNAWIDTSGFPGA